jgi:hypothetical protein
MPRKITDPFDAAIASERIKERKRSKKESQMYEDAKQILGKLYAEGGGKPPKREESPTKLIRRCLMGNYSKMLLSGCVVLVL